MGMLVFNADTLSVSIEYGPPWATEAVVNGKSIGVPGKSEKTARSRAVDMMPVEIVGQRSPSSLVDTLFGAGKRTSASYHWRDTGLVSGEFRAWALEKHWLEGGGDNWFGPLAEHRHYVAGRWIREGDIDKFLEERKDDPVIESILRGESGPVPLPAEPRGPIESYRTHRLEEDGIVWEYAHAIRGLRRLWVKWPTQMWGAKYGSVGDTPFYGYVDLCRCGKTVRYASDLIEKPAFVDGLPDGHEWTEPTNADGQWAAFWEHRDDWEKWARSRNIYGREVVARFSYGGGSVLVSLDREHAEAAWRDGASPVPPTVKITKSMFSPPLHAGGEWHADLLVFGPSTMVDGKVYLNSVRHEGNPLGYVAPERGLQVPSCITVRGFDDDTKPESHERVIRPNGLIGPSNWV